MTWLNEASKKHNDGKGVWIGGMRCMDRRDKLMREHVACRRRSEGTRVDRSLPLFMITCKTSPSIFLSHTRYYGCATSAVTIDTQHTAHTNNNSIERLHEEWIKQ